MLQALFATPAEKSWIEEVSWIPEKNRDYIDRILRNSGGSSTIFENLNEKKFNSVTIVKFRTRLRFYLVIFFCNI